MTAPAFQLPSTEEESEDLSRLTGVLNGPTSDAELDATASWGLRIMQTEQSEIDRFNAARDAELRLITEHYAILVQPHRETLAIATRAVEECARRAQFIGKAKSRKVGNGSYGRRQVPESVKIVDRAALITWLENHYPQTLTQHVETIVAAKDVKPVVIQHMKLYEGEVAPGVEYESAHDEPFAKPF